MDADLMVVTEREVLIELLELYRDLPGLWDTSHELYNSREARHQAYETLFECYAKYDKNATLSDMKRKLENMRAAYKREKKKVEKSMFDDSQDIHVPSLWYYRYMSFLDEDPITFVDNGNDSDARSEEPARKKTKLSSKNQVDQLVHKQIDLIETAKAFLSSSAGECPADAFGRTISCQLKELPKVQRCLAEKLIGEVMYYAKMDQLNVDTVVYLNDDTESH